MPAVRRNNTTWHRDRQSNDPNYEDQIQEAMHSLESGKYQSRQAASRDMKVITLSYACPARFTDWKFHRFH
jgi:hypothetical protein